VKAVREIKGWVLTAAGIQSHAHAKFVTELKESVSARFPDMEVDVSYVPIEGSGGPGAPWVVTGSNDHDGNRKMEIYLGAIERHVAGALARKQFGDLELYPEDPRAKICGRCRKGIVRETHMSAGKAMHEIATKPNLYVAAMTGRVDPNRMSEKACSHCRVSW